MFQKAAEAVDFDTCMKIVDRVRETDDAAAGFLEEIIKAYQFDKLQGFFKQA